jgi:hypothetical protein
MKKITTLLLFSSIVISAMAQYAVPNFSFENWKPNGPGMWPEQWEAYDSTSTVMFNLFERRQGGTDGNYSIKLNCYEDGAFPTGGWLEMDDTIPFAPQAFALDYIIPAGSAFLTTIRVNLYFYDADGNNISSPSFNLTETSNTFKNAVFQLAFDDVPPAYYSMDIKFQNIGGEAGDYVVVDNVRFMETYTPPPPPPTGIKEVEAFALKLYPNPASELLYINNPPSDAYAVKVTGMDGMQVKQFNVSDMFSGFDISAVSSGIYLVELTDNQGKVLARNRFSKVD